MLVLRFTAFAAAFSHSPDPNQTSGSSWCRSGRAVNVRLADLIAQQQKRIIQWLHREKCPM
jgi:hypothetical protein